MSARRILQSFETWRAAREPLVLATVFDTLGSTYSKAGHRILLAANGDYRGPPPQGTSLKLSVLRFQDYRS